MYPKVFLDYAKDRVTYGDCAILPTPVFFYGMEPGDEVSVDIERGKTLIVRFVALSEVRDDGTRQVFFELNGQPRSIVVTDRSQVAKRPPQRKMEAGNTKHVGAPMPGTIATVKAIVGQKVARGDLLLTMEAMKMETSVRAEGGRHRRRGAGEAGVAGGREGLVSRPLLIPSDPRWRDGSSRQRQRYSRTLRIWNCPGGRRMCRPLVRLVAVESGASSRPLPASSSEHALLPRRRCRRAAGSRRRP